MTTKTIRTSISPLRSYTWPVLGTRVYGTFGDITETGLVIKIEGDGWTGTRLLVDWEDGWRGEFAEGAKWTHLCNLKI